MNRAITEQEIGLVAALADKIWHETYGTILSNEQIGYMIDKYQSADAIREQINGGYLYYLITHNDEPVGFCGVHPEENKQLYLSKMYLLKEYYGKGLFTRMLDTLKVFCQNRGIHSIWLTVNRNNHRAIAAYRKNGFTTTRTQVADIGGGFVMDDFVMELPIDSNGNAFAHSDKEAETDPKAYDILAKN